MKAYNVYVCGVGGQGIGLLAEILLRSADYAGFQAKAVDTHGLAQRGGIVVSHLRIGKKVHSPMISQRQADIVIALERHEALRGADTMLRDGGTLLYYNTVLQPLGVRLGNDKEVSDAYLQEYCASRDIAVHKVKDDSITDPRMQNIAVLAQLNRNGLIPELTEGHILAAMEDLMGGSMLAKNVSLFKGIP
jgi:indolepyruvate ferredoxin oxidoreductase beta subunit